MTLCVYFQVKALINISESYYGQLRKMEGSLGNDVPDLEMDQDANYDANESAVDPSFQLSNFGAFIFSLGCISSLGWNDSSLW